MLCFLIIFLKDFCFVCFVFCNMAYMYFIKLEKMPGIISFIFKSNAYL